MRSDPCPEGWTCNTIVCVPQDNEVVFYEKINMSVILIHEKCHPLKMLVFFSACHFEYYMISLMSNNL